MTIQKTYTCALCGHIASNVRNTHYSFKLKARVCANANTCRDRRKAEGK